MSNCHEYLIPNCSKEEIDRLQNSNTDLDWYPDDLMTNDICVYGTAQDIQKALHIIGRKTSRK